MKNKRYLKLLAIATAMAITTTTVTGNVAMFPVYAADKTAEEVATEESGASSKSSSGKPSKDETVYAKTNSDGSVKEVVVSDQLVNYDKGQIKDISNLSDIENVKGDEKVTQLGSSLVWEGVGNDITYQGTTDKALPVSVKVTYKLDGKEINAKDLEGKSGKLTIRYDYDNSCEEDGTFVPFLMTTAMILDSDNYTKLKVTNGKVISDGTREIVVGMGLPKVAANLGIDSSDVDIPEYFEMTANVKDYSAIDAVTVATNDIFNQMDDADFSDLDSLESSVTKLRDASNTLVDGSQKLSSGIDTLLDKSGEMVSGVNKLASGSGQLSSGSADLSAGMKKLQNGVASLNAGMKKLKAGADSASSGAKKLADATASNSDLGSGAAQVAAGLANDGTQNTIGGGISVMQSEVSKVDLSALENLPTAAETLQKTAGANRSVISGLETLKGTLTAGDPRIKSIDDAIDALTQSATGQEQVAAGLGAVDTKTLEAKMKMLNDGLTSLSGAVAKAHSGAQAVSGGIGTVHSNLETLSSGLKTLDNGAIELQAGGNSLAKGTDGAADGAAKIAAGSKTLDNGISSLKSGTGTLVTGVKQLDSGAVKLSDGMVQFNKDGIEKLASVYDGDIKGMLDKLSDMTDASKEYTNFSGISDGTNGSVKFIFISEVE